MGDIEKTKIENYAKKQRMSENQKVAKELIDMGLYPEFKQ